ncbi:hypothetical protein MNBD_GAMMA15-1142 [hydrothermal vent metagenome]|uniref:Glycosyl transferase family 1 domain-containing protein n=1 Tax=hydrothermal vent metagenome TaxID=652676 RepID=A0A3B0YDK1_9ZZZZ
MKTYLVINMPATYRIDLFNVLCKELGHDIKFCFIREPAIEYKKGIGVYEDETFINTSSFYNQKHSLIRSVRFFIDLLMDRPEVIVNGGMPPRTLFLCAYTKIFRKKLVIWWAGTEYSEADISPLKTLYRKIIVNCVDGVIFYSKYALEYYQQLQMNSFPYVILGNNTRDSSEYRRLVKSRAENRTDSEIRFLTVGFQTKRKNTIALLHALSSLGSAAKNIRLLIAGDGPELTGLKTFAKEKQLSNVQFLGNVNPEDMIDVYANSDVFIHPSLMDQWPQTYNEASAAGLPILISNRSGVFDKYIEEFGSSALFVPTDYASISASMIKLANDRELRLSMGAKALENALKYDANYAGETYLRFIHEFI